MSHISGQGETRRTRFVCISDTHNCTLKLPKDDVLIHAGDLTNQGSFSEVRHDAPRHQAYLLVSYSNPQATALKDCVVAGKG